MDRALIGYWRNIQSALDPYYTIPVDRIDALYTRRARSPSARLAQQLQVHSDAARFKVVLCGARGSGKTTEMIRLAEHLLFDWAPLRIDLAEILPKGSSTLAICVHVGAAALCALHKLQKPGAPPAEAELARAGRGFDAALRAIDANLGPLTELLDASADISSLVQPMTGAVAKASTTLVKGGISHVRARLSGAIAAVSGPLGHYVRNEDMDKAKAVILGINQILDALSELERRPVLVLLEGLDKLSTLEDTRVALSQPVLLEEINAPLVLTGPVQLRSSPDFADLPGRMRPELVNNIPVLQLDPDGEPDGEPTENSTGIAEMCDIYDRRREQFELPQDLVSHAVLRRAALNSSGIPREFLNLLNKSSLEAFNAGRRHIEPVDLDEAMKQERQRLTGTFNEQRVKILYRVLRTRMAGFGADADDMLFRNLIACYPNGDLWFRPHELIVESVRQRGELLDRLDGVGALE